MSFILLLAKRIAKKAAQVVANALTDSDGVLLTDSDGVQLIDSS